MADKEALDRAIAEVQATTRKILAQVLDGDVRRLLDQPQDRVAVRLDPTRPTIAAQPSRPRIALQALQRAPTAHARCANTEPIGSGPMARAISNRLENTNSKIKRKGVRHVCRPPSPADSVIHIRDPEGIPDDSISSGSALATALGAGATLNGKINMYQWGKFAALRDPFGHGVCLLQFLGEGYDLVED